MTDQPDEERGTLLHRIVIERWLNQDGEEIITTDKGETVTLLEVLGLLSFASHSAWNDTQRDENL